jgi:hypothetical protein
VQRGQLAILKRIGRPDRATPRVLGRAFANASVSSCKFPSGRGGRRVTVGRRPRRRLDIRYGPVHAFLGRLAVARLVPARGRAGRCEYSRRLVYGVRGITRRRDPRRRLDAVSNARFDNEESRIPTRRYVAPGGPRSHVSPGRRSRSVRTARLAEPGPPSYVREQRLQPIE